MWIYILTGLPVVFYILWKLISGYNKGNNDYWTKRGVKRALAGEIAGGWKTMMGQKPMHEVDNFYYNKYPDAPFVGVMEMRNPILYVRDPELIKKMTVKDFDHFVNRRNFHFGGDYSDLFIFNMAGNQWKSLRAYMSPTFTSGKMRRMFAHFEKSAKDLATFAAHQGKNGTSPNEVIIETRDLFGRFAMDVIGSTAFGIDSHALKDEKSIFYKMGLELQKFTFVRGLKLFCLIVVPKIARLLKISFFPPKPTEFFCAIIARALTARRENYSENKNKNGGQPSDFLQLMVEAQNAELKDEKEENEVTDDLSEFEQNAKLQSDKNVQVTDKFIVANSFAFFLAGFDNTEAVMSVAAYHLAVNPEMQTRLRDEVEEVLDNFGGQVTYDAVGKMTYLDMFVSECLRLYPPTTRYERKVSKESTIPATDSTPEVTLPVDMLVAFPTLAIHRDPKNYPDPMKFDPERFNAENKAKRHPYLYMPFGIGPRSCIAARFVLTEVKAALAHLVHNFEVRTCEETIIPLKLAELQGQHRPAEGLKLALVKRL